MSLNPEQQAVVDYVMSVDEGLILVNAVAGSGKTYTLTKVVEAVNPKTAMYLAYNKSIAEEAQEKFPSSVNCSTIHSLAYKHTVKDLGLKLGFMSPGSLKLKGKTFEEKQYLVETFREFCLSKYTDFKEFAKDTLLTETDTDILLDILKKMYEGKMACTHDFYLKLFHILLAEGDIELEKQDLLMIDEAGDLTEVTLAIFLLMDARIKLAVGDNKQNIYGFNYTVNAFDLLEGQGEFFSLSRSFRVSAPIAEKIERFCKKYIDEDMVFVGREIEDNTIETTAFIARTNIQLIDVMVRLVAEGQEFSLVRSPAAIFRLPLILLFLKYQGKITDPEYQHLQEHVDSWYETKDLQLAHKTALHYIRHLYPTDIQIQTACSVIFNHGRRVLLDTYSTVKEMKLESSSTILTTSHSVKG